jgi:hypothetical protein
MTSNFRQNDDECSSFFEKNRKDSSWDLVRKDMKGNKVVNKGGKQLYQLEENILGLGGAEEREIYETRVQT